MEIRRFKKACGKAPKSRQAIGHQHATQTRRQSRRDEEHQHQDDGQAGRRRTQKTGRGTIRIVCRCGRRESMAWRMLRARVVGIEHQWSGGRCGGGCGVVTGNHDEVMHAH